MREVTTAGFDVFALPGPSSVLTALAVSALPTDRFFFEGFLPSKQVARRTRIEELSRIDATIVMFESGNRVQEMLGDLADIVGQRDVAICRELTKLHEEISRGPLAELARTAEQLETRGEFVVVLGPPAADAQAMTDDDLDALAAHISRSATASRMPSRMRSNCPAGSAAPSMPARSNSPGRRRWLSPGRWSAPGRSKAPSPQRVAAFATGLSAESRARRDAARKRLSHPRPPLPHAPWRDRYRGAQAQPDRLCRGQGARPSMTAAYAVHPAAAGAHQQCRPRLADDASRTCGFRHAFRRHPDCAKASAKPSVSGIRRRLLTLHSGMIP